MPRRPEYGGSPSEHPVFKEQSTQFLMDTGRGRPGWFQTLIDGFVDLRQKSVESVWETIEDFYRKDARTMGPAGDPRVLSGRLIQPPRVYGYLQTLEAQLYAREPKFFIEPLSARQEKLAVYAEQHANAEWKKAPGLSEQMHLCLRDCGKAGWSWLHTSYTRREDENVKAERRKRARLAQQIQSDPVTGPFVAETIANQLTSPDSVGMQSTVPTYERDDRAMRGIISSRRIPYWMMAADPNASCLEDAEWVARQIIVPLESVKRNPDFKHTRHLKATGVMRSFETAHTARMENRLGVPEPYQYIALWETFTRNEQGLWDLKLIAEGHPDFIYEEACPYDFGLPYSLLRWNHDGDHLITTSDIQQVLDLIVEETHLRTRLFDSSMREMDDIFLFNKKRLKETDMHAAVNVPRVGVTIGVDGMPNEPLRSYMDALPRTQKAERMLAYLSILERNIELGLGLGANQQMAALKSETSATEAAEIASWSRARGEVKHYFFQKFVAQACHQRLAMAFQYYGPFMFAHTVSRDGLVQLLSEEWTTGDLQNGLGVTVEKGSMKPASDEQRLQLYTTMISEALANPMLAQLYNLPELAKRRALTMGIIDGGSLLLPLSADQFSMGTMMMALMGGSAEGSAQAGRPPGASNAQMPAMAATGAA